MFKVICTIFLIILWIVFIYLSLKRDYEKRMYNKKLDICGERLSELIKEYEQLLKKKKGEI